MWSETIKALAKSFITLLVVVGIVASYAWFNLDKPLPQLKEVCGWWAERRLGFDWYLGMNDDLARKKAGGRMIYWKCRLIKNQSK